MSGTPSLLKHCCEIFTRWFPRTERSRAVGMTMAGFHLGSVAGLVITPTLLATSSGINAPFVAFGVSGFVWLFVWLAEIARNPQSQPRISREEYQYIKQGNEDLSVGTVESSSAIPPRSAIPPFRLLLSKLPTWAIIIANFMNNWVRRFLTVFHELLHLLFGWNTLPGLGIASKITHPMLTSTC